MQYSCVKHWYSVIRLKSVILAPYLLGTTACTPPNAKPLRSQRTRSQDLKILRFHERYIICIAQQSKAKWRGRHGGRIRHHEKETDDSVPILGSDIQVQVVHSEGVRNTKQRATRHRPEDKNKLQ